MSIQSVVLVLHGRSRIVSSQVRMSPDSGALGTGSFKLADFAQRRLTYVVGQLGLLDSFPIVFGAVGLVLGELLLPVNLPGVVSRRVNLLFVNLLGVNSSRVGSSWIGHLLCG